VERRRRRRFQFPRSTTHGDSSAGAAAGGKAGIFVPGHAYELVVVVVEGAAEGGVGLELAVNLGEQLGP